MRRKKNLPVFGKYPSNGEYYVYCDRSGRKLRRKDACKTWDNFIVQPKDWEPRQPLDFPPKIRPERRIWDTRPEPTNDFFQCQYYINNGEVIFSCVPRDLPLATQTEIDNAIPTVTNASGTVADDAAGDTVILTVSASDPNSLPLKYSIISGDTNSNFKIDEDTGVISLIQISPLVEDDIRILTVQATNTNNLSGAGTITISVTGIFNPNPFGTVVTWFDTQAAGSIVKDGSGRISQWTDQSINTYDYVQNTPANQPQEVSDTQNSLEAVQFSTVDTDTGYYLQIEEQANLQFINNSDSTIVFVGKFYDYNSVGGVIAKSIFGNSSTISRAGVAVSINNFNSGQRDLLITYRNLGNNILTTSTTFTQFENENFILVLRFNSTTGLRALVTSDSAISDLNITQGITNPPDGQNPGEDFYIGVNAANAVANNNNFKGQSQAFYIWSTYLSDEDVTSVVASLKTQWGIS